MLGSGTSLEWITANCGVDLHWPGELQSELKCSVQALVWSELQLIVVLTYTGLVSGSHSSQSWSAVFSAVVWCELQLIMVFIY